jgi:predicted aconitase with swiveling domain
MLQLHSNRSTVGKVHSVTRKIEDQSRFASGDIIPGKIILVPAVKYCGVMPKKAK